MGVEYDVFCGLDVGKLVHHATALYRSGQRVHDGELPQDEARLRELFAELQSHGRVLVVVDQPNTIGALPIAVATRCRDRSRLSARSGDAPDRRPTPGPGQDRRPGRLRDRRRGPGTAHTLRRVDVGEEALAELTVLVGFDDDLAAEATG